MKARRQTVPILTAISVGLALASSCFPLLASVVASLGPWSIVAVVGSGGLAWLISRAYAELAGIYPTAAGVRTYIGQAFGDGRGLWLALLYLFLVVGLGASESYILSKVLELVVPGLAPLPVCLGFVAACTIANLVGFEPAGKLQATVTTGLVGGLATLGLCAVAGHGAPPVERAALEGLDPLVTGLAGAIFLFVGFEWVVSAVEEADPEGRSLPRALSWSVGTLTAVYTLLALAFWIGLSREALGAGVTPHVALGAALGGRLGLSLVAALSTAATITSFNGGILGASRLTYALAREGVLPRTLTQLSERFLTPWAAILTVSGLTALSALALATTSAVKVPILVGAAIECFVYSAVALAFAKLRQSQPARPRPYVAPFGPGLARVLAVVFAGLGVSCIAAAGEWAPAAGASLGAAALTAGAITLHATHRRKTAARAPRLVLAEVTRG